MLGDCSVTRSTDVEGGGLTFKCIRAYACVVFVGNGVGLHLHGGHYTDGALGIPGGSQSTCAICSFS